MIKQAGDQVAIPAPSDKAVQAACEAHSLGIVHGRTIQEMMRLVLATAYAVDRLVKQPKCPDCEGKGWVPIQIHGDEAPHRCPRCDGSGYDRMVALAEVKEALREYGTHIVELQIAELERRFGGGE